MLLSFHFPLWICSLECISSCWELECWYLLRPQALSSRRSHSVICSYYRLCSFEDAVMSMQSTPVLGLWYSKAVVPHYQTISWKGVYGTDALWLMTVCCENTANFKTSRLSVQCGSVTELCPTLRPLESQQARPPCPSPTPGVHSNSHPLSRWCHPAISSSVIPFSSCPQSLPASESFPMS